MSPARPPSLTSTNSPSPPEDSEIRAPTHKQKHTFLIALLTENVTNYMADSFANFNLVS